MESRPGAVLLTASPFGGMARRGPSRPSVRRVGAGAAGDRELDTKAATLGVIALARLLPASGLGLHHPPLQLNVEHPGVLRGRLTNGPQAHRARQTFGKVPQSRCELFSFFPARQSEDLVAAAATHDEGRCATALTERGLLVACFVFTGGRTGRHVQLIRAPFIRRLCGSAPTTRGAAVSLAAP